MLNEKRLRTASQPQQLPPESGAAEKITKWTGERESFGTEMSCGIEKKRVVHFQVSTTLLMPIRAIHGSVEFIVYTVTGHVNIVNGYNQVGSDDQQRFRCKEVTAVYILKSTSRLMKVRQSCYGQAMIVVYQCGISLETNLIVTQPCDGLWSQRHPIVLWAADDTNASAVGL